MAVLVAAKDVFEERGWAGATIRKVAERAAVSPKTVEATFGTKALLLADTVTFAIRGDTGAVGMRQRPHIFAMEAVPTAAEMLDRHASHLRAVNERSARLAFVVEAAAPSEPDVGELWGRMNANRLVGVRWATQTLLAKPGTDHLKRRHVESVFLVAFDWGTYRVLTSTGSLTPAGYERWLRGYYARMLLGRDLD